MAKPNWLYTTPLKSVPIVPTLVEFVAISIVPGPIYTDLHRFSGFPKSYKSVENGIKLLFIVSDDSKVPSKLISSVKVVLPITILDVLIVDRIAVGPLKPISVVMFPKTSS